MNKKYFKQLDLPHYDVVQELNTLLSHSIQWHHNQICLNTTPHASDDYTQGCGSLALDWKNAQTRVNSAGVSQITVNRKKETERLYERDFTVLCDQFKNTVFEDIYKRLCKTYTLGRVRLIKLDYKTCMTWHKDPQHQVRLHYPIITAEGNFMVIGDEIQHMPQYTWWQTDTSVGHTAFNSSKQDRIHLVAVVL